MTTELADAITHLTKPWNEVLTPHQTGDGYVVIDHQPRLHMLRDMIGSNAGGTTAGRSLAATRNLLNLAALDLWQHIDEQTRATVQQIGARPHSDLLATLDQLATVADTLRSTNNLTEADHARIITRAWGWKTAIDNLLDPPTRKEIKAACPDCAATRVTIDDGETWAIVAYYWKGHQPAAKCQACDRHWQGERELLELGYSINADMDHVTLRAMGVA